MPSEVQPTVDIRILGFTLLISGITGLLFGLLPALRISRAGFVTVIKDPGRSARRWRQRTGTALVIVEVALALVLMAGAGLMLRSLHRVLSIDPGFEPERVLVLEAIPVMVGDGQVQRARVFYAELMSRVRRLPGVEAVGAIDTLPFWSWAYSSVEVDGPERKKVDVSPRYVLPGYFQAMGVPLKLGRAFTGADRDGAPCAVVLNETAARRLWHDKRPLGRRVRVNSESPWCEVMGIVGNARHEGLEEAVMPEVYFSALQSDEVELTLVARVENPSALAPLARTQTANLTERALVQQVTPFDTVIARSVSQRRHRALLLSLVGGLGVLLAGVGIFGLTSYAVARRTPEIGVRMALGATPRRVVQTVLAGFVPAIVGGVALGLVGAWATTRLLAAFVFGITPTDPLTLGTVSLLLTVAALAACYLPARRALRVDPVVALRAE
ncbi:MAG: ABC transporter permease [Vicinamibacteraceae bacterium]